jgi:hypothetical protein
MKRGMFALLVLAGLLAVAQPAMAFHRHRCRGSHCSRFFAGRHGHGGCPYGGCGQGAAYPGAYASMYGQFASYYPNPPPIAYGSARIVRPAPAARVSGYRYPSYGFGYPMAYPGRPYFPSYSSGYGSYRYAAGSWYGTR